jgi:hypothetical protein
MDNSVVLSVGDAYHLKIGKDRIIYAGMPSETVYSIVQKKTKAYWGWAWNLYYPKKKSEITIDRVNILIESVTPDEIRLRVQ